MMSNKNKLDQCVECGSTLINEIISTIEHPINNKILVIANIPAFQCSNCQEIYYPSESSRYIDNQIAIFNSDGFQNKAKEISKEKGYTQEALGSILGVTKQRVNQILSDNNLDVKTMYKVANAINEPIQNVFKFNQIIEKDHKFYIENE